MGLFGKLIGRDPTALLAKGEEALDNGEPGRAAELAAKVLRGSSQTFFSRAEELAARANLAQVDTLLERVVVAEQAELFAEALDYVEAALQRAEDESLRRQLEQRRKDIVGRLQKRQTEAREEAPERALELSPEEAYDTLLGTLTEENVELYTNRPDAFRQAWLALNDGRPEDALGIFDQLFEAAPEDPILRLERGRCLLLTGELARAREDFDAAWSHLGDQPLDYPGDLSLPCLWGEAGLAAGKNADVVERLADLAHPKNRNPRLSQICAQALLASERFEEAEAFLASAQDHFPAAEGFAHDLGALLDRLGRRDEAIAVLEKAIAPSCSGGGCGQPPMHPPTLRLLARLYLDQGGSPERAGELLTMAGSAQGGFLTDEDHRLRQRHEEATRA